MKNFRQVEVMTSFLYFRKMEVLTSFPYFTNMEAMTSFPDLTEISNLMPYELIGAGDGGDTTYTNTCLY